MMEPASTFFQLMFGSHIWQSIGWDSIIYLAAIASINPELYEAAKIDGANKCMKSGTLPYRASG